MKDFIRDKKGKVTECPANIAKMNPFEFLYYDIKYWGFYGGLVDATVDVLKELGLAIAQLFVGILWWVMGTIFFPALLIPAYFKIRKEKEFCKKWSREE